MAVVKSNELIDTGYSLPAREQVFLLYIISQISIEDFGFKVYSFHWKDIQRQMNFDNKVRLTDREEVFNMFDMINGNSIKWTEGTKTNATPWFTRFSYDQKTETYEFKLNDELKPYLIQLKEKFTQYHLKYIVYLKSNDIRMYEILKRYEYQGDFVISVEDLRFRLGLTGSVFRNGARKKIDKYGNVTDLRRYVINKAQRQLKKYTDIAFEYQVEEKIGKNIKSFRFFVYPNEPEMQLEAPKLLGKTRNNKVAMEAATIIKKETKDLTTEQKIERLTHAQLKAYDYLGSKKVNQSVILDEIIPHYAMQHERIRGYEDLFLKMAFHYVEKYSKAKNKTGAFVTWWKKGLLTRAEKQAQFIDKLIEQQRSMSQEVKDNRRLAQSMSAKSFQESYAKLQAGRPQMEVKDSRGGESTIAETLARMKRE